MQRLLSNMGWLLGSRGVTAVLSLGYLALATRALGLEGFGRFALIVGLGQSVVGLASFQTWQLVVRWGGRAGQATDTVGFAVALDLLAVALGALGAGLTLWLIGDRLLGQAGLGWPAFAYCCASLMAIRSTPIGILRRHDKFAWDAAADGTTPIVRFAGAGLAAAFAPTIQAFLVAWGAAELASAGFYWAFAMRLQRVDWRSISLRRLPRQTSQVWSFVAGNASSRSLAVISRQVVVLLVGFIGGPAAAGIYRVASQIGFALLKLAQTLLFALYPALVRDPDNAHAVTGKVTRVAIIGALCAVTLAAAAGSHVLALIAGSEYSQAHWPTVALTAASGAELVAVVFEALMVSRGRALEVFLLRGVMLAIALSALPWLMRSTAAPTGAALAVCFAALATLAALALASRRPVRELAA